MGVYQLLMLFIGFAAGVIIMLTYYYFPMKKLRDQVWKLKGQVYYWSRQMPVNKKKHRPKKVKSV